MVVKTMMFASVATGNYSSTTIDLPMNIWVYALHLTSPLFVAGGVIQLAERDANTTLLSVNVYAPIIQLKKPMFFKDPIVVFYNNTGANNGAYATIDFVQGKRV